MSNSNMNLKLVTGLLVASGSATAFASMNNLDVQSNLGERFSGSIVVTGPTAQEILKSPSSISVSGAPVSARVSKQGTSAVIHLRSNAPINDPVLQLRVQAGSESRQYSAIIDPRNAMHQQAQVNSAKAIPQPPVAAVVSKPAARTTIAATALEPATAAKPAPKVNKGNVQNNRPEATKVKAKAAPAGNANVAVAQQYTVQPKDTIFDIARRYQPEGLNTAQTVQALMRANPQAFRNHNPNLLYGDVTLNIPSAASMHQLATGRLPKQAVAAAAATTAVVASTATTTPAAANDADVANIQKQLADLESQKAQLEKQLAAAETAKNAAPAPVTAVAPEAVAVPASVVTASAPVVSSSPAVVTEVPVTPPPAPAKPAPLPPVAQESSLGDLLVQYLPFIGGALVLLLILAALIARFRKKAGADDSVAANPITDSDGDDDIEIFNFDDAALDNTPNANKIDLDDIESLTPAELAALDAFNPSAVSKPTLSIDKDHNVAQGAALLAGGAVLAASQASGNTAEQDFMPSDDELAQYAQASANNPTNPATNDFNLDDLDSLLKQNEFTPTQTPDSVAVADDFNFDFDVNSLATNSAPELGTEFDFSNMNMDAVVTTPVATSLPQAEEVQFTELDQLPDIEPAVKLDLGDAALGLAGAAAVIGGSSYLQDAHTEDNAGLTLSQDDINTINFDDFNVSNTNDVVEIPTASDTDKLFDLGFDETPAAVTADADADHVSKFNSISMDGGHELAFDDTFDLNFDELLSLDTTAETTTLSNTNDTIFTHFDANTDTALDAAIAIPAVVASDAIVDNVLEQTDAVVAEPLEANDFINHTILQTTDEKPAQAWASTGNFGGTVGADGVSEPASSTADTVSEEFNLNFSSNNAEAMATPTPTTPLDVSEDNLDFALDSVDTAIVAVDASAAPELTDFQDVNFDSVDNLDFALDGVDTATTAVETTTAPVLADFQDLNFDSADNLDFSLDGVDTAIVAVDATAAPALTDFQDLNFDLSALNLDEVGLATEPSTQPAPTANPEASHNFDFSLDDLVETPAPVASTTDLAALNIDEDFNLDDFASVETLAELNTEDTFSSGGTQPPVVSTELDAPFEMAAPTVAELEAEPAALADSNDAALPIANDSNILNTLQHTQDAKLDLAQMYIEIGDKDAAREILIDLSENGNADFAERAEKLYQTL